MDQIKALGLKVNIAFVGNNLLKTIDYLENQSASVRSGKKSYLLFHYAPSVITTLYNMTSIKFEPCDQVCTWRNHFYDDCSKTFYLIKMKIFCSGEVKRSSFLVSSPLKVVEIVCTGKVDPQQLVQLQSKPRCSGVSLYFQQICKGKSNEKYNQICEQRPPLGQKNSVCC